jgi:hypothetical protein
MRCRIDRAAVAFAAALALAGCGAAKQAHEARYTGALPECGLAAATLTRQGEAFAFAPGDGALVIRGAVAADGGFAGTLNTQPPGKPPFELSVHGRIAEETAMLDYATPRCHTHGSLARVHPPMF